MGWKGVLPDGMIYVSCSLRVGARELFQASFTSFAARSPDCSAPCIHPVHLDVCSPAKCTHPSGRSMPEQSVVIWPGEGMAAAPPAQGSASQTFEIAPSRLSSSPWWTFSISRETNSRRLSSDIAPTRFPTPKNVYETNSPLVPGWSNVGCQISCGRSEIPKPL